jgi:hypothetical protein
MPFPKSSILDPTTDPAAPEVIAAFQAAQAEGLSIVNCYKRAVEAWAEAHPDQTIQYASCKAVEVIMRSRHEALMRVDCQLPTKMARSRPPRP